MNEANKIIHCDNHKQWNGQCADCKAIFDEVLKLAREKRASMTPEQWQEYLYGGAIRCESSGTSG